MSLRRNPPQKREPVVLQDRPWRRRSTGNFGTVMEDGRSHRNNLALPFGKGHSVFIDPMAPSEERYKLIMIIPLKVEPERGGVFLFHSPDGIRWEDPDRIEPDPIRDQLPTVLSRDGISWHRFREPYFPTGPVGEIDSAFTYLYTGMLVRETEILQYYFGTQYTHHGSDVFAAWKEYPRTATHVLSQRVDGFGQSRLPSKAVGLF